MHQGIISETLQLATLLLVCNALVNNQTGFAMVHSSVEGVTANKRAEGDEAGMMRRLGQLLAKLHACLER